MRKIINSCLLAALFILAFGLLLAIGAENDRSTPKGNYESVGLNQLKREDIPRLVEIIRIWKLVDEVGLQEEQLVKFLPRFKELNDLRSNLYKLRQSTSNELKKLLESDSSEERIKPVLNKARSAEADLRQKERQIEEELYSILTIKQQAKFNVFQDSFHRDMGRLMRNLREISELKEQKLKSQSKPLKEQTK